MTTNKLSALLVAGLLATTLAACSSDDGKDKNPKADKSPSETATSADPDKISPPLKDLPVVKGRKGAITDLTMGECDTTAGKQSIDGEITSSANKKADFLITVSWTTAAGDVMGRGFKVLRDVAPGATESFTIKAKVSDGATQCVKGVDYGRIA